MPGGLFSEAYSAMEHVESTMQNKPELQPAPKTSASPKMDATAGAGDEKGKKKRGFGMGKLMGLVHIGAGSAAAAPEAARPGQLALAAEREQPHKPGVRVPSAPTRMNTQQLALGGDSGQEAVVHGKTRKLNRNTTLGRISRGTWKVEDDQPSSIPTPPKMSKKKDGKGSAAGSKVTFGSRWSKASPRVSEGSEGGEGSGSWSAGDLTPHERGSSAEELEESDHLTALYHDPEHGPGGKRHSLLKASVLKADARQRPLEGHHPRHPYEALVFKGGGAKGSIYPGAIKALEDLGVMPYIKRFAGASAGAVTAALLAAGLTAKQLYRELTTIDLSALVLDQDSRLHIFNDMMKRFGMHPGNALYQHLGKLFYKYLGFADVTFRQLYDAYGVELAIAVTNVSRASVELLHVKTAPNYPIRKAVRMSMSIPVLLQPCRERNIHGVVNTEWNNATEDAHGRPVKRRGKLAQVKEQLLHKNPHLGQLLHTHHDAAGGPAASASHAKPDSPHGSKEHGGKKEGDGIFSTIEYYVDGGVLLNYPIEAFDGWWLSMKPEDSFYKKLIGTGGHANYVSRFEGHNETTLGFRLNTAFEPDAMQSRLGNDKLELKLRATDAALLPNTPRAEKYALQRTELTDQAKAKLKLEEELRHSMDWLKKLRKTEISELLSANPPSAAPVAAELPAVTSTKGSVTSKQKEVHTGDIKRDHLVLLVRAAKPPQELLEALGVETVDGLVAMLRPMVDPAAFKQADPDAPLSDYAVTAEELEELIIEIEHLLEGLGESLMARLVGMEPKEVTSLNGFVNRLIEAVQMTNDEHVHTKENMRRTCMLNTEYVGTVDFKMDEGDFEFLWRKGYASTELWLLQREQKRKKEAKAKAESAAVSSEIIKVANKRKTLAMRPSTLGPPGAGTGAGASSASGNGSALDPPSSRGPTISEEPSAPAAPVADAVSDSAAAATAASAAFAPAASDAAGAVPAGGGGGGAKPPPMFMRQPSASSLDSPAVVSRGKSGTMATWSTSLSRLLAPSEAGSERGSARGSERGNGSEYGESERADGEIGEASLLEESSERGGPAEGGVHEVWAEDVQLRIMDEASAASELRDLQEEIGHVLDGRGDDATKLAAIQLAIGRTLTPHRVGHSGGRGMG